MAASFRDNVLVENNGSFRDTIFTGNNGFQFRDNVFFQKLMAARLGTIFFTGNNGCQCKNNVSFSGIYGCQF